MHLHVLRHMSFEGPGRIADWAEQRGHRVTETRLFEPNAAFPDLADLDALVVMGGPMSVGDTAEHLWLIPEKRLIREAIAQDKRLIGVCLGAQLIAEALGAQVHRAAHREIGWFPVELTEAGCNHPLCRTLPVRFTAFHWHGDTFGLPPGAVQLASSAACAQQIFAVEDRILGLQCHLEIEPAGVEGLCTHCAEDIQPGPWVEDAGRMCAERASTYAEMGSVLFELLDRFMEMDDQSRR